MRKMISSIKEYDTDDNIKFALFSIIYRSDHDLEDNISEINGKARKIKESQRYDFYKYYWQYWQHLPQQEEITLE